MATLYKRPASRYWVAVFQDRFDVRRYRSTGCLKKTEARDVASSWELAEKKAKKQQIGLQMEITDILNQAARLANKAELTIEKAQEFIMELYNFSNSEDLPSYTVGEWLDKWLDEKSKTIKQKTYNRYSGSVESVKKSLGKNVNLKLELFTAQHLKDMRTELIKNRGRARNATINMKVEDFKSALTSAYDDGLIKRNVGKKLKPLPEDDSKIVTHFEPSEVKQLHDTATSQSWKTIIILAPSTGLRLSDLIFLHKDSVKLERRCLVITPSKQQRSRKKKKTITVPLSNHALTLLTQLEPSDEGYMFADLVKKTTATHSTNFNNLMKRANVAKQVTLEDGSLASRSFHSFRHSFGTWLLKADVGKDVRKTLMAHSSDDVHEIYASHDEETLRGAIEKLPVINTDDIAA